MVKFLQCVEPTACRRTGNTVCSIRINSPQSNKGIFNFPVVESFHVDALGAAPYGFEQEFRLLTNHDEHGFCRRLFNHLEHLVGTFGVHSFRQPDDIHLISPLARLQAQFSQQQIALAHAYQRLLVGGIHALQPYVHGEIRAIGQHFPPLVDEIIARHLVFRACACRTDDGIGEHQVGMRPFAEHGTLAAMSACVILIMGLAQQIGSKSHSQCHFSCTLRSTEQQGMWQTVFLDHLLCLLKILF